MRNVYNHYWKIPKNRKISEKTLLTRVAATVVSIVLSLVAMSATAYAYFSYDLTSTSVITAAKYETDLVVTDTTTNAQVPFTTPSAGVKRVDFNKSNTEYTIKLSHTGTTQTGFCIIKAENCDNIYVTRQLGVDLLRSASTSGEITFRISVSSPTTIDFISNWGTSTSYPEYNSGNQGNVHFITDDNVLIDMPINVVVNSNLYMAPNPSNDKQTTVEENVASNIKDEEKTSGEVQNNVESQKTSSADVTTDTVSDIVSNAVSSTETDTTSSDSAKTETATEESSSDISDITQETNEDSDAQSTTDSKDAQNIEQQNN